MFVCKMPVDFRAPRLCLSQQSGKATATKAMSNLSKGPVFFVERLKQNMSLSQRQTARKGQSWSCVLAYKVRTLSAACPAARMVTWKRRCEQGTRAQAPPPGRSAPGRLSPWAAECYQWFCGRRVIPSCCSPALQRPPFTRMLQAPHDFREGDQWLHWKCLLCLFSTPFSSQIKQETQLTLSKVHSDFLFPDRLTAPTWKPTAGSPSHPGQVL